MKATKIPEKAIHMSHCDWIVEQAKELKALIGYDSQERVLLNKARALSCIETMKHSLSELELFIENIKEKEGSLDAAINTCEEARLKYDVINGVESIVYGWLNRLGEKPVLDVDSPDYKQIIKLVKELCEEQFPELAESVFGDKDEDFIFKSRLGDNWYNLFYYNPDSVAGGQIVMCSFNKLGAAEMTVADDCSDVLADYPQRLADVNSEHFFGTVFDLLKMKVDGYFLGSDLKAVCHDIIDNKKDLDDVIKTCETVSKKSEPRTVEKMHMDKGR